MIRVLPMPQIGDASPLEKRFNALASGEFHPEGQDDAPRLDPPVIGRDPGVAGKLEGEGPDIGADGVFRDQTAVLDAPVREHPAIHRGPTLSGVPGVSDGEQEEGQGQHPGLVAWAGPDAL